MNITSVKGILNRKFGGASIDDIQGISDYSLFQEAASNLLNEINPAETVRHSSLEIFRDIYDYSPPADIKTLLDERPQTSNRSRSDNSTRRFSEEFDQLKANNNNDFTLEWIDGARVARFAKSVEGGNTGISTMESLTANGTWDGTAANIAVSTHNPYKGSGSIQADFDTGEYIENDDMTKVDLSDHKNKSTIFLAGYFPDASLVTSIGLRWGSSTSAYFSRTKTAPQFGSFRNGWNLIPFAWNGATETGTVDTDNMDYIRITYTGSSDTDIKFDNVFSALGEVRELVYYSKYLFRNSTGTTWLEVPTADTDIVNLDSDAENLFVYECIRLAALQLQGQEKLFNSYTDFLYGTAKEVGKYARYNKRNPDEAIQPQSRYRTFSYNKK